MIFYLNKGLILEQVVVKVLQNYFNTLGIPEFYKGVTVSVSNKHPFARLLINSMNGTNPDASLFPAVVVATLDESKPGELENLIDVDVFELEPDDVNPPLGGDKSPLEKKGYMMMTPQKLEAIREAVNSNGHAYAITHAIRRQDRTSIEIWAENIQLKNELYEAIRLFVCGWMKEALEKEYEENGLTIFDKTVRGQRSNNVNVDFGIELWGAYLTFEADYIIEQTVIDTDLVDTENIILEVINHVKGQDGTTRSIIFGEPDESGAESAGDIGGDGE